ncbi:hypothetical protein MIND_01115800 [Mycena indigotica]|uniref:Uncharacterized protein n=1 Tax=Mycena indigotica TaxID=2126181 RepID=A0A8H6S5S6_9AGAR|nr:uncharacterized protein MIND_01115800 [Mycena indigotica]KAF7293389.1 hypothetical protein MIND_01115800 [Mycena indigotica]
MFLLDLPLSLTFKSIGRRPMHDALPMPVRRDALRAAAGLPALCSPSLVGGHPAGCAHLTSARVIASELFVLNVAHAYPSSAYTASVLVLGKTGGQEGDRRRLEGSKASNGSVGPPTPVSF